MRKLICATALSCFAIAAQAETAATEVVFVDGAVAASLTGVPGDPVEGRKVFSNRKQGNCLACHMNSDMTELSFHGEVGPPIDGVSERWEIDQLRGIVINSKMTFEDSIMPSFYRTEGFERTLEKFDGKTVLTGQQVEDVVAYLLTLKYPE